eukprot:11241735-Alexandrium_andersonii.AAC.1
MTARLAAALRVSWATIHRRFQEVMDRPSVRSACQRVRKAAGVMSPRIWAHVAATGAGRSCMIWERCRQDRGGCCRPAASAISRRSASRSLERRSGA